MHRCKCVLVPESWPACFPQKYFLSWYSVVKFQASTEGEGSEALNKWNVLILHFVFQDLLLSTLKVIMALSEKEVLVTR